MRESVAKTQAGLLWGVALVAVLAACLVDLGLKTPRPLGEQPQPDAFEYADSAWHLAHGYGFVTARKSSVLPPGLKPPDKPPGYPLLLAPFTLDGRFPLNAERGAQAIALLYPIAAAGAALAIGGPLAALLVTIFVWLSPFASTSAVLAMSDALAGTLALLLMPLVHRGGRRAVVAAGFLAGFGVVVRLNSIVILGALLLTLKGRDRLRALLGAAPCLLGLAAWQWAAFGAPWRTGYYYWKPNQAMLSLHYLWRVGDPSEGALYPDWLRPHSWPNQPSWILYPAVLAGLLWVFAPPLIGAVGLVAAAVKRRSPVARLTLWTVVLLTSLQLVYYMQSARFIAQAASMLIVVAGIFIADGASSAFRHVRPEPGAYRRYRFRRQEG